MNKSIIMKLLFITVLFFALTTIVEAIDNPLSNQTSSLYWRENGVNYSAPLLVGDYYHTSYDGWCNAGHVTSDSTEYNHVHITSTFNYWYGFWITESLVDDYWDNRYAGYYDLGGLDQTSNCYGYATGHDTWVDGIGNILTDEYVATNTTDAEIVLLGNHMKKITAYFNCPTDVRDACETHEKNRDSGIYKLFYLYQAWPDPSTQDFVDNSYKSK